MENMLTKVTANKTAMCLIILFFGQLGVPFLLTKEWKKAAIAFILGLIIPGTTALLIKAVWIFMYLKNTKQAD